MSTASIRYAATDAQEEFIYSTEKRVLGSGGYAGGKSSVLAISCVRHCILNPGLFGMAVADTFGRLARDFIPKLARVLDDSGIEYEPLPKEIGLDMKTPGWLIGPGWLNHRLLFVSMKNPNLGKGPTAAHVHVEEATVLQANLPGLDEPTFNVLDSRLRAVAETFEPTNVMRLSGTPESVGNWTMQPGMFWRPPRQREKHEAWRRDFRTITMSTWDSERAGFLPKGFTQSMVDVMTPDQVMEKIEGIPRAGGAGRAYQDFLYERNVPAEGVRFDRWLGDIIIGLDFNVDPMCAVMMQKTPRDGLQIFDEIVLPDSNTRKMAREIVRRARILKVPLHALKIFPDASGNARHPASDSTSFGVLREEGLTRIVTPKANGRVSDRLETVNAALYHRRLIMDAGCTHTIEDFEQTGKNAQGELIKTPGRTHCTDASGYPVVRLLPIRRVVAVGLAA